MASRPKRHSDLVAAMRKHVGGTPSAPVRMAVEDGGTDAALAWAEAAVAAGRPLRPNERRQVRREVLAVQEGPARSSSTAGQTLDEWIESLSERERDFIPRSRWFAGITKAQQAHVLRRVEALEEIEAEAEFRNAQWLEEQSLQNIDALAESEEWVREREEESSFGEELAARLAHDAGSAWGVSDEAIAAAAEDLASLDEPDDDFAADEEVGDFEDGDAA